MAVKVVLTSEKDRYESIYKALNLLTKEITAQIKTIDKKDHLKNYILIKPNCVVENKPLAATHPEAIRAVLDFLAPIWQGPVFLAEGAGVGSTMTAFQNYGYLKLKIDFPELQFLDLNYAYAIFVDIFDNQLRPLTIKIANKITECPFRISIGPPKTHDAVIVTCSIKNLAVGSILKEDKPKIHQGFEAINRSIAALYEYTFPHLAIIDGWEGMEGDGPSEGEKVETHFCLASMEAIAADTIATEIIGFNPENIGYLNYLGAPKIKDKIEFVGQNPFDFRYHFKPHKNFLKQLSWQKQTIKNNHG